MKNKNKDIKEEVSIQSIGQQPEDSLDMINKYGTYNIQPTATSDNVFPEISQGFPKLKKDK